MAHTEVQKRQNLPHLTIDELLAIVREYKYGRPNYGAILKYYREQMGWSGAELVLHYSRALKQAACEDDDEYLMNRNWIYSMETKNTVPISAKRRWILARLLNIPPVLFGLSEFSDPTKQEPSVLQMSGHKSIDLVEYRSALLQYHQNLSQVVENFQETIPEIQQRLNLLSWQNLYAQSSEKKDLLTVVCEYHILLAVIFHEHKRFEATIDLLSRVISIAEDHALYDTWAYALRQRAVAHLDRGELTAGPVNFANAQQDFKMAVTDFDRIKTFDTHLSPQRRALILLPSGHIYGQLAQNQQELSNALKLVDAGNKLIDQRDDDTTILDKGRYHLDKGIALIASPFIRFPKDACREFDLAAAHTPPQKKLRQVEISIRQAEAYFFEGSYPMATAYAGQTLELIQNNPSSQHLPRVENLYNRLRESSYGKNGEVADLSVEILKVQKPELFR